MAKKFLTNIDFSNLEAYKFRFQNLASAPTGSEGSVFMNTATHKMMFHNGTMFVDPTDRAQHTGTQLAATISDLSTAVVSFRLDQFAAPTTSVSFNSQKLTNLLPGVAGTDAVNLNQLLAVKNNTDWKDSVRVATTANITLSGLLTIDGVTLVANDRVLVKNNSTGSENGIYVAASGAWTRASDADNASEVTPSMSLFVEEGTVGAGTQWRIINTGTITVGTTALVFTQFGAAVTYVQGAGISISGTTVAIDTTVVTRKYSATIGDGAATSITVTHGLNTVDVTVTIREVSTNALVECDIVTNSATQITLGFAVAPTSGQYRVTVLG